MDLRGKPGEDGSADDAARASVTAQVLRIYLGEALREAPESRALLLGCTHYPLLRPAIERTLAELGRPLRVIDSAQATARVVARILSEQWRLRTELRRALARQPASSSPPTPCGSSSGSARAFLVARSSEFNSSIWAGKQIECG